MNVGIVVASWLILFICSLIVMNIAQVHGDRLVDIFYLLVFLKYPQPLINRARGRHIYGLIKIMEFLLHESLFRWESTCLLQ